jgi:hypothetical protein
MKYPKVGNMVTVVLEGAITESGFVEEWGDEWIEIRDPNTDLTSCIKEKYVVGFKILDEKAAINEYETEDEDEEEPVSIKGVQAEQLNYPIKPSKDVQADGSIKFHALKTADAHLDRISNERKNVEKHFNKTQFLKKYPLNYNSPGFLKLKK